MSSSTDIQAHRAINSSETRPTGELTPVKVLLADDHAVVRSGLRLLLESTPDMIVVGDVGDGREALEVCRQLCPDVVLTDVEMASLNGIEAARQIRAAMPEVRIVMLSMHDDPKYVHEALKAGASGYVLKGAASADLLAAIRAVVSGERYLSPKLKDQIAKDLVHQPDKGELEKEIDKLSAREREILQLIAEGRSNAQVARMLYVSTRTVEFHRANIMQKLGIHSIAGLTKFAIKHGLTSLG